MSEQTPVRTDIAADLRRVSERLRNAPLARVTGVGSAVRAALQQLADAAQGTTERGAGTEPHWREVPALIDSALGDQVAVVGADLLVSVATVEDNALVWSRTGHVALAQVLNDLARTLKELRFAL